MKLISIIFTAALLSLAESGFAQGFTNLNFEQAIVSQPPGISNYAMASDAIPGWTASPLLGLSGNLYIGYDGISLGGAAVFLMDSNAPNPNPLDMSLLPIQGSYSVLLDYLSANIKQTGTIPITAQSLIFSARQGGLQVFFKGQALSFIAISNSLNYTVYGADISQFVGQTGELFFTTPGYGAALIDNIQFSSLPVPEPSAFALTALGALFFGFHRRRR